MGNTTLIKHTLEMVHLITKMQNKQELDELHRSQYLERNYLTQYKDDFIKLYGEEKYEEQLIQLSKSEIQLRDEKNQRIAEKEKREEEKWTLEKTIAETEAKKAETNRINAEANLIKKENERKTIEYRQERWGIHTVPKCPKCREREHVQIYRNPDIPIDERTYTCKECSYKFGWGGKPA
jgi:hypothetical protein